MSSGTVVIWGIASTILLIGSCCVLNAPTYYQELENRTLMNNKSSLKFSTKLVLRDHQTHTLDKVK